MTEAEKKQAIVVKCERGATEGFFAFLAVLALAQICQQLHFIKEVIRADTNARLCISAWEKGGDTPACKKLRDEHARRERAGEEQETAE